MSSVIRCGACKSRDVQEGLHEHLCLECGRLTRADGTLVPLEEQFSSKEQA